MILLLEVKHSQNYFSTLSPQELASLQASFPIPPTERVVASTFTLLSTVKKDEGHSAIGLGFTPGDGTLLIEVAQETVGILQQYAVVRRYESEQFQKITCPCFYSE
ncbi:hypothetical protein Trydic_g20757 [Trypoxylus dichotomus]